MQNQKIFRRIVGFLYARIRQLPLAEVPDPRSRQGQRWKLKQVIAACLLGMMAGCKNLQEVEELTKKLSRPIRKRLGIPRRLPDTTARDVLCALSPQTLLPILHEVMGLAFRAKSVTPDTLPFHMAAMDGKWTALPVWSGPYAQKHTPENGVPFGIMRTVTSVLASASSRPCIDVSPIPAATNEMGHFQTAFDAVCERYGSKFRLVSYDQGANSDENARYVLEQGKDYLFRLNDERRHMQLLAMDLLSYKEIKAETHDVVSNKTEVIRRLRIFSVNTGHWQFPRKSEIWEHAQTLLSVESEMIQDGVRVSVECRYYATSLPKRALTPEQWLACIRFHWAVETTHQTLDLSFEEDDRPWIKANPNGMLVVLILRRIAYTLLTLYRKVTLRSDHNRSMPWKRLFEWIRDSLVASSEATVESLRRRRTVKIVIAAS